MPDKICSCCGVSKDEATDFPIAGHYKGEKKKRKICKACWAGKSRERDTPTKRRIREINRVIRWPVMALVLVIGTYSHDYVSGRNRICFYETIYGEWAVTLDAMQMCPLTWEWEDD